jgi:hypothetical protein
MQPIIWWWLIIGAATLLLSLLAMIWQAMMEWVQI